MRASVVVLLKGRVFDVQECAKFCDGVSQIIQAVECFRNEPPTDPLMSLLTCDVEVSLDNESVASIAAVLCGGVVSVQDAARDPFKVVQPSQAWLEAQQMAVMMPFLEQVGAVLVGMRSDRLRFRCCSFVHQTHKLIFADLRRFSCGCVCRTRRRSFTLPMHLNRTSGSKISKSTPATVSAIRQR